MNGVATLPGLAPVYEATTAAELQQLWRFRHGVYVEELGRKLGRDDGDRSWVHDTEDDQAYTLHDRTARSRAPSTFTRSRTHRVSGRSGPNRSRR